ncbi:MAG: O-antigen ligase family protein [Pseudomonadales bacterium]
MSAFAAFILFVIYLNVPAVAVREYGIPFVAGAAIPLLLLIPMFERIVLQSQPLRFPALIIAAAVLLCIQATGAFLAIYPEESLRVVIEWGLEGVLLTLLIVNIFRTRADAIAAVNAVIAAGAIMGAIVLLQQALGATDHNLMGFGQLDSPMVDDEGQTQRRLAGPIGETNRFAQVMAVLIPVSAAMAVVRGGLLRYAYIIATLLISGGMALAFSRGVIVAMILAVPFALFFRILKLRHIAIGLAAGITLLAMLPHYAERVWSIGEVAVQTLGVSPGGTRNADGAARGRLTEMKATVLVFADHPLLGAGMGMAQMHYPEYAPVVGGNVRAGTRQSHNLYLQLAAETGIIGLAVFTAIIVFAFAGLEHARKRLEGRDPTLWGMVCGMELGLIIYLGTSLFLHSAYIRYFWLLLGLCVVVSTAERAPVLLRLLARMLAQTAQRVRAGQ